MTIESWKYGNPEDIADRLIEQSAHEKKRELVKKERLRQKKSRRIQKLVREAMK